MPPILFFSLLALFFLLFDYGILPASIVVVVVGGIFCLDSRVPFWMYLLICAASILLLYWLSSFLNYKLIKLRFLASDIVERVREHSEIGELHMIELSFVGVSIKGSAGSVNNIVEYRISGDNSSERKKLKFLANQVRRRMGSEYSVVNEVGTGSWETGRTEVTVSGNTVYTKPEEHYYNNGSYNVVNNEWHRKQQEQKPVEKPKKIKTY